jgi:hypothetical protein
MGLKKKSPVSEICRPKHDVTDGDRESRIILYSHFFHLKKKYGSTAAITITTNAIG